MPGRVLGCVIGEGADEGDDPASSSGVWGYAMGWAGSTRAHGSRVRGWRARAAETTGDELAVAVTTDEVRHEAADLLYFAMVRMKSAGVGLAEVAAELDRRALQVRRRGGDAKPGAVGARP